MFIVDDLLLGLPFLITLLAAAKSARGNVDVNVDVELDVTDVNACRAAVPVEPGLKPTTAMLGGMFYDGRDPELVAYLDDYLQHAANDAEDARSVLAFRALQGREGTTAAVNTYDNQLFTYGTGWGGLGGLPRVMSHLVADDSDAGRAAVATLAACGVWYLGDGQWSVVDDNGNVVSGKKEALEVIRATPAILDLFIHLAKAPETRDAIAEAQLKAWCETSGSVPEGHEIATQALYNLVTHLQHWAPGYMKGALEAAASAAPGAPSPERDRSLAREVVRCFYENAAGHGWIPAWKQLQGYVLRDMKADGLDVSGDSFFTAGAPPVAALHAEKTAGGCGSNAAPFKSNNTFGSLAMAPAVLASVPGVVPGAAAAALRQATGAGVKTAGGCGQDNYPDPYSVCSNSGPFADTYMPFNPPDIVPARVARGPGSGNSDPRFVSPAHAVDPRMSGDQFTEAYEVFEEPELRHAGGTAVGSGYGELYDPADPYRALRRAQGPGVAPTAEQVAIIKRGIVPAVQDGSVDDVSWCNLRVGDPNGVTYDVVVTCEPLAVSELRLPVSFADAIAVSKLMGALPITPAVADAAWAHGLQVPAKPLNDPHGAIHNDPGQIVRYNAAIGPNTGQLTDGYQKDLVLVPGLQPSGRGSMAQYGFRHPDGSMYEHGGPSNHNRNYKDYSDTPRFMGRQATRHEPDGSTTQVDLLDELEAGCVLGGPLPAWLVAELRGDEA